MFATEVSFRNLKFRIILKVYRRLLIFPSHLLEEHSKIIEVATYLEKQSTIDKCRLLVVFFNFPRSLKINLCIIAKFIFL